MTASAGSACQVISSDLNNWWWVFHHRLSLCLFNENTINISHD